MFRFVRRFMVVLLLLLGTTGLVAACGGGRAVPGTVKVAVLQDPSRDLFLYALEQGLVRSDEVEVEVSKLPMAAVIEAVSSRQFDILEASVLAVPGANRGGMELVMLSPALVNRAGTLLVAPAAGSPESLAELDGKTIGVASLGGTFVLESRALLGLKHGLDVSLPSGAVRYQEVPAETIPTMLEQGKLDAAVLMHMPAFRARSNPNLQVLTNVTEEVKTAFGLNSVVNSVLVTYGPVVRQRSEELREALALLQASADYFYAHKAQVMAAVAAENKLDESFLNWWLEGQDFPAGVPVQDYRGDIEGLWNLARELGDMQDLPAWDQVVWP